MKTKPLVTVKSICRRPNKAMGSHCSSGQQLNRLGPTSDMRTKLNVSSFLTAEGPLEAVSWCKSCESKLEAVQIFRACREIVHKQSWVHVSAQCSSPHWARGRKFTSALVFTLQLRALRQKLFGHKSSQNLSLFHHLQDLSYRNRCSWKAPGWKHS